MRKSNVRVVGYGKVRVVRGSDLREMDIFVGKESIESLFSLCWRKKVS